MPEKYFEEIDEETKIIYYYSFSSEVVKFFKKQPEVFIKFKENIKKMVNGDRNIDIKIYQGKIKKQSEIFRRLRTLRMRIGNFRVIFMIKEEYENLKIYTFIIKADSRGDVYKNYGEITMDYNKEEL